MYKAKGTEIVDETGKQIAILLCTNCSKKDGKMMAAFAAQQMMKIRKLPVNMASGELRGVYADKEQA